MDAKSIAPLPDRLRQYRELRGLTQEQLADRADVSRATVIHTEAGQHMPSLRTIAYIAEALDVTVQDLWSAKAPPKRRGTK